jgi:hypothetical protein
MNHRCSRIRVDAKDVIVRLAGLRLLVGLLALAGCRFGTKDTTNAPTAERAGTVTPSATEARPAPRPGVAATPGSNDSPAWTPDRLRTFVLETTAIADKAVDKAYKTFDEKQIAGECWGGIEAPRLIKAAEIVPLLAQRLEGRALQCYIASYFGCRIGDWLARAGLAQFGPGAVPFTRSKVTIVEQTPDRVVADFIEAETVDVKSNGELDKEKVGDDVDFKLSSRYTLSRDARGVWRISDRVPSFPSWECRE